jgi:hypothetical protein
MQRAAKKRSEIDKDAVWVCWQTGSAQVNGEDYSFQRGQRLRGDHPLVLAMPAYFVRDGEPLPSHWDQIVERTDAERPPPEHEIQLSGPVPQALERTDTIVLKRAVVVRAGYVADREIVRFEKGDVFSARSELASVLPDDAYEPAELQFTQPKGCR